MGELSDEQLEAACKKAVEGNPKAVADFLGGKEKAIKALIGPVMRETRGKADAQKAEALMVEMIRSGK